MYNYRLYSLNITVNILIKRSRIKRFLVKTVIFFLVIRHNSFIGVIYAEVYYNMIIEIILLVLLAVSGLTIQYKTMIYGLPLTQICVPLNRTLANIVEKGKLRRDRRAIL